MSRGRGRSGSSPVDALSQPLRKVDFWQSLVSTLAPCIQRLVSCSRIHPDVAPHLLSLPLYPRTPRQTKQALQTFAKEWAVEYSAGQGVLAAQEGEQSVLPAPFCEDVVRLVHPACKARATGVMTDAVYAEHCLALIKTLCWQHWRSILTRYSRLGRHAIEQVCESLLDSVKEKVEEGALSSIEIDVALIALRRL